MKSFDPEKFTKWINKKNDDFRKGNVRLKVVDFAKFIGERQQTVSYWLLGKLNSRPSDDACNNLIKVYGYEAYDPLGLEPPLEEEVLALLPKEDAEHLLAALIELRSSDLNNRIDNASPEDRKRIMDIFSKHGVSFNNLAG